MGKRYLKNFDIYQTTDSERTEFMKLNQIDKVSAYLEEKYQIRIPRAISSGKKEITKNNNYE